MNCQKKVPEVVKKILQNNGVQFSEDEIHYYAWPQLFNTTAGPKKTVGGDAITSFTVEVYVCERGPAVYLCANMYYFEDEKFKPFKEIYIWKEI